MKTVLIISEYNPFHLGHGYQIEDIRSKYGSDTNIIALMSGTITQRGEFAILDKYSRAECAVNAGVNLVLLLPFPYSASSAELFARAGVSIANALGVVDVLAFGSECGDVELLKTVAKNMLSDKFTKTFSGLLLSQKSKTLGHPKLLEIAYREAFDVRIEDGFFTPNNILAIEYIKALISTDSTVEPYTTRRIGTSYSTKKIESGKFQSATAIRNILLDDFNSALDYIPKSSKDIFLRAKETNSFYTDCNSASQAVLSYFCLNAPKLRDDIHDADGGLYNRLINSSYKAKSISHLTELVSTKKYTTARIRRVIWYSFFGVTSSDVKSAPRYTQVLAMDFSGQALLKRIKKTTAFPIVTKPSVELQDEASQKQKNLSDSADMFYELLRQNTTDTPTKSTPFVKK